MELSLSEQEVKIINYLQSKSEKVALEELAQFAKNPLNVKKKTIQRVISEIKRKYKKANLPLPFSCSFTNLAIAEPTPHQTIKSLIQERLVQIQAAKDTRHPVQKEFELDRLSKRVRTKYGFVNLNDPEWEVFKYIYNNPARLISLSELRDKVVYPQYGSKLPPRWFFSIMRTVNNLRRQVYGLNNRLFTVKSDETSYIFQ